MTFSIYPISAFSDNYIWLVHTPQQNIVIDPGQAAPVMTMLEERQWKLDAIWITHHHSDHVDGVGALQQKYKAQIYGARKDADRLPALDYAFVDGEQFIQAGSPVHVIETPGHTIGHICFYVPHWKALFSGDTLFSLGCGRLFEGTASDMFHSLGKLKDVPDDTDLFCGHEYTLSNAKFAQSVDPENIFLQQRVAHAQGERAHHKPTLPVKMGEEKKTNPFLRASNAETLGSLRKQKDNFG